MIKYLCSLIILISSSASYAHEIQDSSGQLCVDTGRVIHNGSEIYMYPCNGGFSQTFIYDNEQIKLPSGTSFSYCLDVGDKDNLILSACNSRRSQRFNIENNIIKPLKGFNKCLTYDGFGSISSETCSYSSDQRFSIPEYCLYENANYKGERYCADGDKDWIERNDDLSSVSLINSNVVLYEHGFYNGKTKQILKNTPYVGDEFNDISSSVKSVYMPPSTKSHDIYIKNVDDLGGSVKISGRLINFSADEKLYLDNALIEVDTSGVFNTITDKRDIYNFKIVYGVQKKEIMFSSTDRDFLNAAEIKVSSNGFDVITQWLRNKINESDDEINDLIVTSINKALEDSLPLSGLFEVGDIKMSVRDIDIDPKDGSNINIKLIVNNLYFSGITLWELLTVTGNAGPVEVTGILNVADRSFKTTNVHIQSVVIDTVDSVTNSTISDIIRNIIGVWLKDEIQSIISTVFSDLTKFALNKFEEISSQRESVYILDQEFIINTKLNSISSFDNQFNTSMSLDFSANNSSYGLFRTYSSVADSKTFSSDYGVSANLNVLNKVLFEIQNADLLNYTLYNGDWEFIITTESAPYFEIKNSLNAEIKHINSRLSLSNASIVDVDFGVTLTTDVSIVSSIVNVNILNPVIDIKNITVISGDIVEKDEINRLINLIAEDLGRKIKEAFDGLKIPEFSCLSFSSVESSFDVKDKINIDIQVKKISNECDIEIKEPPKVFYSRGVGTVPFSCGDGSVNDAGLCYPKCKVGYTGIGPVCWNDINEYGRGVGIAPTQCPSGSELDAGLCYPKCNSGYYGVGPVCHSNQPLSYGRGAGTIPGNIFTGWCPSGKENDAGLCYPKCKSGYHGVGPVCWLNSSSYGRGVGVIPNQCSSGSELDAGLCYPKCSTGLIGVGPMCWPEPMSYGRGAGSTASCKIDEDYDAGLCYLKCTDGYKGIGPMCHPI